jgi:uncharacterized protein (DUF58 family)
VGLLTRRGWSLAGAAIGLIVAGRLLGTPELTGLGICGVALLVAAATWTRRRPFPARLVRTIRPAQTRVGAEARVDLELVAHGATPRATITDAFDDGRRAARFVSPPLERHSRARAAYRIPTDRRGRFAVGDAVVGIGDPFGMTRRMVAVPGRDEIVVVPRVHELRRTPPSPGQRRSRTRQRTVVPVPTTSYDEFLTLRAYEPGDDLRRVHWRSSARLGDLMVRDDETSWQPRTVVVLDNRPGEPVGYEIAIEATASIAVHLRRARRTCELLTTGGRPLGARAGTAGRTDRLLEELATITPDVDDSIGARIHALRPPMRRGTLVVVTAHHDITPFTALAGPGAPVIVVACGPTMPVATRRHVSVISGHADRLATEWSAVSTRPRVTRARP